MKRVVSVSLGSSKRDHAVETEILGEKFSIERIGTNGDVAKAMRMISELDGQVDAIGLGGTDLYIHAGGKRYVFRESLKLKNCARQTPVVDGSSLKNTLERRVVSYMEKELAYDFRGKKVLMVSAVDRFGMAEALSGAGAEMVFGDLMFGLGLPLPIDPVPAGRRPPLRAGPGAPRHPPRRSPLPAREPQSRGAGPTGARAAPTGHADRSLCS